MLCEICLNAQSITGLTGLVSIPTAEVMEYGKLTLGTSFYHKNYLNLYGGENYNGLGSYISLGLLPFVEISFRLTRYLNYPQLQGIGDRMPSIRVKLLNEGDILPAFLLGAHDFFRTTDNLTSYNASTYLALTKNFNLSGDDLIIKLDLGYGGFRLLKSTTYQFNGLFYGASLKMFKNVELIVENDALRFNGGLRVSLFNCISFTAGLMSFRDFSGTISYSFLL